MLPIPQPEKTASISLKFVVVGGGLSGLATAYSLRTAGHDVVIVEQRDVHEECEGSIRCPPNMTRILQRWPGMEEFFKHAAKISGLSFRIGETCDSVGFMKLYDEIMEQLEADFYVLQHNDLKGELLSLCLAAGVEIVQGVVVDIETTGSYEVNVVLCDTRVIDGNIVIGADGYKSITRAFITPESEIVDDRTMNGVNISIPMKDLVSRPELLALCQDREYTIWMSSGSSMTAILNSASETFNLSFCTPFPLEGQKAVIDNDEDGLEDGWDREYDISQLPIDVSKYDSRIAELIQLGKTFRFTSQRVFEQEEIVGLDGMLVLVGDAAHSVLMHGSHNTSMAFEDAVTLGSLFSRLCSRDQISALVDTYEELRTLRTRATLTSEYQALLMICLPPGSEQEGRDETLRLTRNRAEFKDFDDCDPESDLLVQVWEQYLVLFKYDAKEFVENWWSKWGFALTN
ncbi:FAD-binding-3 domain-containing protein [Mycena kentingensis (nom. inval.)]|nr:FAD-binding-3 domain-containing protein [Mycena kentingensis (nom. inval.)]